MLNQEAEELTTLIVARHILISRAMELEARYDAMAVMHEAPFDRVRPSPDDDETLRAKFEEVRGELVLVPALLLDLEQRIGAAWDRLRVVPRQ